MVTSLKSSCILVEQATSFSSKVLCICYVPVGRSGILDLDTMIGSFKHIYNTMVFLISVCGTQHVQEHVCKKSEGID